MDGWMDGWLDWIGLGWVGLLDGWLVYWMVGWFIGWLDGQWIGGFDWIGLNRRSKR